MFRLRLQDRATRHSNLTPHIYIGSTSLLGICAPELLGKLLSQHLSLLSSSLDHRTANKFYVFNRDFFHDLNHLPVHEF